MACGACPAVAAGSEGLIAAASQVAAATPATEPQPEPSAEPQPAPSDEPQPEPSAEPQPQPEPSAEPQPAPSAEPQPQPEPSAEPQPQPEPSADPEPDPDPQPDSDRAADDEPAADPAGGERPSGQHAAEARPVAPAAAGAATNGTQVSAHGALPGNIATAALPGAAVVETATDPSTRTAARGTSIVAHVVSGQDSRPAERPIGLGAGPGQVVPDLLTALRAQTEQRGLRARARAREASRNPTGARRAPSPVPILPLGPPPDIVVGSAAGPGGITPLALWCVLCTGSVVQAAHELRRLQAALLAPDLPGLPSLRDRPG
jgi:hypothetical protein